MLSRLTSGRWTEKMPGKPPRPAGISPLARVLAELAWPELKGLEPGECAGLTTESGTFDGMFYKVDPMTVECHLDNGQSARYVHDSDEAWVERRKKVRRLIAGG